MAYAKTTLKTNSSKASPFFQNTLNRECIRQMNACPDFSCEHILINLIRFMVYENAAPSLPPYWNIRFLEVYKYLMCCLVEFIFCRPDQLHVQCLSWHTNKEYNFYRETARRRAEDIVTLRRRFGRSRNRYGIFWEEKNLLFLPEIEPEFLGRPASSRVTKRTKLSRLHIYKSRFA